MEWIRRVSDAHTRLKKRIHGTRIPLSPRGIRIMKIVYFTTPIIGGYFVMQWAQNRSMANLRDLHPSNNPAAYQNDQVKGMLKDIENNKKIEMDTRVDAILNKLRQHFEIKSGYGDAALQAKLLEKHFRFFDTDNSGFIDYKEFTAAMIRLNFVGVQAELEDLFDRFDENLDGQISYVEFANGIFSEYGAGTPPAQVKDVVERIKQLILDHGGKNGIRTLLIILRRMDANGDNTIDKEEFHNGLLELGADPRDVEGSQLDKAFKYFDRDDNGRITIDELLRGLRGRMIKRRVLLVRKAFDILDTSKDGQVTFDELASRFDTSHHPDVLSGRLKPHQAVQQLLSVFSSGNNPSNTVSWHDFLAYYKDLSAGISNDDEFELIVRNAWHMSGGDGWCENTTCRRVLVTHSDGSQQVCEIVNDLAQVEMTDSTKKTLNIVSILTKQAPTVAMYTPKIIPPDDVMKLLDSKSLEWSKIPIVYQNAILWATGYVRSGSSYYKVYTKDKKTMEEIQFTLDDLQGKCNPDSPCGQNKIITDSVTDCTIMKTLISCAVDASQGIPTASTINPATLPKHVMWGYMRSDDSKTNITVTSNPNNVEYPYSIHINEATDDCGTGSVLTNTIPCFDYSSSKLNVSQFGRPQQPNTIEELFRQIAASNSPTAVNATTIAPIVAGTGSSLSTGAIIGIVVGVLVVALIVFFICYRRHVAASKNADNGGYYEVTYTDRSLDDINSVNAKLGEKYPELANFQVDSSISLKRLDYTNLVLERLVSNKDGYEVIAGRFDNTQVMVKRLSRNARAPENLISFAASLTIMATVSHPQMTTIVGVGWDLLENLCIITEATHNGSLRDALNVQGGSASGGRRKKPTDTLWTWKNEKIALAMDIAKALVYLHTLEEPTAHGYLTSRDVFIVPDSESGAISAKVNSAALHSTPISDSTMSTTRVPTNFEWIAPEVLAGNPPSLAADIYAFGIILTELDTNAMPYSDTGSSRNRYSVGRNNHSNIVQRIMKDYLRPELSSSAPQPLIDVVNMCLEKDPLARPTAMVLVYHLRSKIKPILS
ncbi:calcyphosin [Thraustotheca clavata]|uniref:Calcyphosin n=1 Tax=Thraustotheca clavata TaxID=74557 RepID=A0A1W0A5Q4_9STRA|nr:calcyphosin [Thraustotheca clavata]